MTQPNTDETFDMEKKHTKRGYRDKTDPILFNPAN